MAMRTLAATVTAALLATGCHGATPGARATAISATPTVAAVALHSDPPVSEPPAEPVPATLTGEVYSAKAAANRAHELLGYLQLPPGATPIADPSGPTGKPPHDVPPRNLVSRSRWWSWSGTVAAALSYLHKHEPMGLALRQRSTDAAGLSRLYFTLLQQPPYHATVTVFLVRVAGHVVFRVDGQATWLQHRAAAEFVPLSTPVVELTAAPVDAGAKGLPRRHMHLHGPNVSKLVPWLDFIVPEAPGQPACVEAANALRYSATFRLGHRVVLFRWEDGCDLVSVAVNGKASVSLNDPPIQFVAYLLKIPGKKTAAG